MADLREAARRVLTVEVYEQPHIPRENGGTGFISDAFATALVELRQALAAEPTESLDAAVNDVLVEWRRYGDGVAPGHLWNALDRLNALSQALRSEQDKPDDWQPRPGEKVVWSE